MSISEEELSGLLDGELPPERAAAVRAAVEADPALREAFTRLQVDDAAWRAATKNARFRPAVRMQAATFTPAMVTLIGLLGADYVFVKSVATLNAAFAAQAITLCVLLAFVYRLGPLSPPDAPRPA
jgi:anti-sigma factor RsiW